MKLAAILWKFNYTMNEDAWTHLAKLIQSSDLDVNAQDEEGDTFLHHLLRSGSTVTAAPLHHLAERRLLARCDLFVVNAKGETPLQLAQQIRLRVGDQPLQAIFVLTAAWRRDVRPLLKHLVEAHLALIHDLTEMVLEFVDGGGPAPARA
jgi:hypothetical protein